MQSMINLDNALITIGITCFREGDWLMECWKSVLAQTDDRWEAVVVMDGTQHERTQEIFAQLKHPKLRKFAMPENVGPYPTRNKAFELTQTPYHFYLDGDDQLPPDAVEIVLKIFEQNPDIGFVYGDYECFGRKTEIWRYPHEVKADDFAQKQPTPGGCAYKKQVWEELGGFSTELAWGNADYDFFIGAYEAGIKGQHSGQIFYRYRLGHDTKVSSNYNCRYHETHEKMVRRHIEMFSSSQRRNRFLTLGYRRAALANQAVGNTREATRLAKLALRHAGARDIEMYKIVVKGYLPSWVFNGLRNAWHWGKKTARGYSL